MTLETSFLRVIFLPPFFFFMKYLLYILLFRMVDAINRLVLTIKRNLDVFLMSSD